LGGLLGPKGGIDDSQPPSTNLGTRCSDYFDVPFLKNYCMVYACTLQVSLDVPTEASEPP